MLPPSKAGQMTQIGVLEYLKLENVTLSNQLTETQHRSIKEKERIAVQLQSIEVFKKKKKLIEERNLSLSNCFNIPFLSAADRHADSRSCI